MVTNIINLGGANTRIGEDILARDGGVLRKRGELIYSAGEQWGRAFKGVGQHSTGLTFRPPPSVSRFPGGIKYAGIGAETSPAGYGSADSGSGFYLRLDRAREDVYYTMSARFCIVGQDPGSIDQFHLYNDTQNADNTDRSYAHWGFFKTATDGISLGPGKWRITGDAPGPTYATQPYIDVPNSNYFPGDNENKMDSTYVAASFFHAKNMSESHYGHFQIGGQSFDLRGLGGGYAKVKVQAGTVPFQLGLNFGMSFANTLPGKSGGFILERLEITVGDELA